MTSPGWQGEWHHSLILFAPQIAPWHQDTVILEVTGDDVGAEDDAFAQGMADRTGLLVAHLMQVPNQPIDDRREDDLIAHSFEMFLATGDERSVLLTSMVDSVLSAMGGLQLVLGGQTKFLVTGASKRGWTSWLAGATQDPRILAIAPRVFDNLRMDQQVRRQIELWGSTSPMIDDYVRRQLHEIAFSAEGADLLALVDPGEYLHKIHVPALVINGANDAYWAPDGLALYADDLPAGSRHLSIPNLGHSNLGQEYWMPSLKAFAHSVLAGNEMGRIKLDVAGQQLSIEVSGGACDLTIWEARSRENLFWDQSFLPRKLEPASQELLLPPEAVDARLIIAMARYQGETGPYWLTSVPRLIPPR